jgi:hypothetical protein
MSDIDPSVFRDDTKIAKSDLREQFQIAADEITALQIKTSLIRRMAYEDALFDTL